MEVLGLLFEEMGTGTTSEIQESDLGLVFLFGA